MSGVDAGDPAALRAARLARLRGVAPEPASQTSAVLRFRRPGAAPAPTAAPPAAPTAPACDLDRLPGIGPGLVWALRRAGIGSIAELAPLAPDDLVARLGPPGRLAPAAAWIATAQGAAG